MWRRPRESGSASGGRSCMALGLGLSIWWTRRRRSGAIWTSKGAERYLRAREVHALDGLVEGSGISREVSAPAPAAPSSAAGPEQGATDVVHSGRDFGTVGGIKEKEMTSVNEVSAQESGESRQQHLLREFLKVQEQRAGLYSALHSFMCWRSGL